LNPSEFSELSEDLRKFGDYGFGGSPGLRACDDVNRVPSQSTQACRRLKLQNAMCNITALDGRWLEASSGKLLASAIGDNMASANLNTRLDRLRERWSDPLLTALTVLLILMLFVFAPLQAIGIRPFQLLGFVSALGIIGGVFLMSGSPAVVAALLAAFTMAGTAAISRLHSPSILDVYLLSGAFLIMGIVLACVVARAVFSPGRVNYHRIIGAILVYLSIALTFVALYSFVGLLVPDAFSGMTFEDNPALASKVIYFSFVTLTSTGYGDVFPLHPVARSLCNLETIIGQLYPATLLARLVSLEIEGRR
jgi:hypothetical protein